MALQDTLEELDEALSAIHRVLADEYAALCTLDGAALEETTARKLEFDQRLRVLAGRVVITPRLRDSIQRVRVAAQTNQALLLHARACVRGALAAATGTSPDALYVRKGAAVSEAPVRINMRG